MTIVSKCTKHRERKTLQCDWYLISKKLTAIWKRIIIENVLRDWGHDIQSVTLKIMKIQSPSNVIGSTTEQF